MKDEARQSCKQRKIGRGFLVAVDDTPGLQRVTCMWVIKTKDEDLEGHLHMEMSLVGICI